MKWTVWPEKGGGGKWFGERIQSSSLEWDGGYLCIQALILRGLSTHWVESCAETALQWPKIDVNDCARGWGGAPMVKGPGGEVVEAKSEDEQRQNIPLVPFISLACQTNVTWIFSCLIFSTTLFFNLYISCIWNIFCCDKLVIPLPTLAICRPYNGERVGFIPWLLFVIVFVRFSIISAQYFLFTWARAGVSVDISSVMQDICTPR